MKNRKSLVFLLGLCLIFSACKNDKTNEAQNEKSVVIKTEDQIQDENLTDNFYDLVDKANEDLSDEEKTFLAKTIKAIEAKDLESLSKNLGQPLKNEIGGDLRVLADKLTAIDYTGPILEIKEVTKKGDSFLVIGKCKEDSLVILLNKDGNKLTGLNIKLLSTISKNKDLKEDHQAFVDRAYDIIESLKKDDKESFAKYAKGLGQTGDDFDKMYDGLKTDLAMAGNTLTDKSKVKVSYAKDLIKTAPVDQNLVDVTLVFTFENIEKIVYDFTFTEDMDLVSIEISPDEKDD
ncbi:hypothetical protein [Anaerococcus degeneri]|uniref:Lipoprotein n=1 Tax=Anaerococcus degeneri TaxID=361500 RepID=A0ABS7Z121_9FIRM|nr:hypothetical protein [Anaerococcus degeneri]MBP2015345.1 hypothetical protein [Anaerococcus degeneri]MCA2096241.1 hypothetical protein [Anaerococcus degeneri]